MVILASSVYVNLPPFAVHAHHAFRRLVRACYRTCDPSLSFNCNKESALFVHREIPSILKLLAMHSVAPQRRQVSNTVSFSGNGIRNFKSAHRIDLISACKVHCDSRAQGTSAPYTHKTNKLPIAPLVPPSPRCLVGRNCGAIGDLVKSAQQSLSTLLLLATDST